MLQNFLATILVLLTGEVLAQQCFSGSGCTGSVVVAPGPSASDCCVGTDDGQSYGSPGACTIPQCIVHGFEQLSYTTPESDILQSINFRPNVKGTGQPGNIGVISGIINLEEDTAVLSDIAYFRPVTVPQETNEALNIQLIPQYDTISLELNDRVKLRFTPNNPFITPDTYFAETGEFLRDSTFVHIVDDDNLILKFWEDDYNVAEENRVVTIGMTIRATQIPFTLKLTPTTVDGVLANTRLRATDYLREAYSRLSPAGRASPGQDFDATIINKRIPPSSTTRQITQNIVFFNDNINEIEQSFVLVAELGPEVPDEFACFQVAFGDAVSVCRGRVGVTGIRIRDNDPMILGFGERRQTVSEADAPPGEDLFDLDTLITSLRRSEIAYPVGVRSVIDGQPIIEPLDDIQNLMFDGLFGSREMNINNLVWTELININTAVLPALPVFIRDDNLIEEEECFVLSIFQVNPQGMTENFICNMAGDEFLCIHKICITDDDEPFRVGFDQTIYTVVESAGSVEVCVSLTHPPDDIFDERVTVLVFHNDNSIYVPPHPIFATPDPPMGIFNRHNMIPRSDYEEETQFASTIRSTFIEEERRQICYNQVIYDDARLELIETAGLGLVPDDPDTEVHTEAFYDDCVFYIIDDDEALVGLERTIFTVSEDLGVVELCARVYEPTIDCPIEFPFNTAISTADGTAVTTLTFAMCDIRRCVNVNIMDEEPDEVIMFTLRSTPGLDPRIIISTDDVLTVGYEITTYQTSESMGFVSLSIALFNPPSGGAPRPFTLSVSTRGGTAVVPEDYEAVTSSVIQFDVGDIRVTHTIRIIQDQICETDPNEVFFSNIAFNSGVQPIIMIRQTAEIIIDDSAEPECNPIRVGYERAVYTTDEGQRQVQLCVIIYEPDSGRAPRPFSLLVTTSDSTAVFPGDYESVVNEVLDFIVGQDRVCHNIGITDDDMCENEYFFTNLRLGGGEQPIDVDPEQAQVIIDDTDEPECVPVLSFSSDHYVILESESTVELCLVLNIPLSIPALDVTVTTTTTATDTATAGVDYIVAQSIATFRAGTTESCINIVIINDDIVLEGSETFTAQLSLFFEISVDTTTAVVTIIDDDMIIGFFPTSYTVTEGEDEVATLAMERTGSTREAIVTVTLVQGSATFGADLGFISTIFTVTFAAGVENVLVQTPIPIVDDTTAEETEMFTASLTSTDQSVQISDGTATVYILDNDRLELYLINESPRVTANSVEAEYEVNGRVSGVRCVLRSQVDRLWQDCSPTVGSMSGAVSFTNLNPGLYALKVQAYSRNAVVPTVKRGFVITSDPNYCSLVLVNRGVTVTGNSAMITTQLYGLATQLSCTLDGGDPFICRNSVFLSGLESGRHVVEISPLGCSGGSKTLSVKFSV